jgi:hypothetical protein
VGNEWIEKCSPCKIGTIPKLLQVHGGDKVAVGKYIRVKYAEGGRWEKVLVTEVHDNGYFKADK